MGSGGLAISFSPVAIRDLEAIFQYRKHHESLRRAQKVVDSLLVAIERLPHNPKLYPEFWGAYALPKGVRKMTVYKTYHVLYRIGADQITVLRIYHGAQNPRGLTLQEPGQQA